MTQSSVAGSYIRGGGGMAIDGRRLIRILLTLTVLLLTAFTVVFSVIAFDDNSRIASLKNHGVPVEVTVSGCVGMASGTGITEVGYGCIGSFTLQGHHYDKSIRGSSDLHEVGQRLAAVVVPSDPSILYTASSVARMHRTWTIWVTPAALLVMLLAVAGFLRRRAARSPS